MNNTLPSDILFTSPKELATEQDNHDERVFLNHGSSRKQILDQNREGHRYSNTQTQNNKNNTSNENNDIHYYHHYHQSQQQDTSNMNEKKTSFKNKIENVKTEGRENEITKNTPKSSLQRKNSKFIKHSVQVQQVQTNSNLEKDNILFNFPQKESSNHQNCPNASRQKNNNNDYFLTSDRIKQSTRFNLENIEAEKEQQYQHKMVKQVNTIKSQAKIESGISLSTNGQQFFAKSSERHVQFGYEQNQLELSNLPQIEDKIESNDISQRSPLPRQNGIIRKILKSASQILNIKNSKLLNQKINQQQKEQQQTQMVIKRDSLNALLGWVNLKNRIEALKFLMRNIEMSGMIQIISKLKVSHMNIIEDIGSDYQVDNKQKRNKQEELENLETFHSQIPLTLSFPDNEINIFSTKHAILRLWFVLPFFFEILLNFNLSFFEHGEKITSKFRIIARYLQKDFWWDISGLIGSSVVFENENLLILLFIFILRLVKLKRMYDSIEEKFQLSLRFSIPYTLLNLFLSVTLVAHICGCLFQWIGSVLQSEGTDNWLSSKNLADSPISDRYIAAIYFSLITMITVGYGDIVPISKVERVFVMFMTFFSCGVFAYVVSSIGELLSGAFQNESVYKQQKYEISNYMETRAIHSDLQTKVFQFLEMLRKKKQQEPESGQGILDIMNPKLKESIYKSYYGGHLKNWKLFSQNFSSSFLELLSISCTEQVYGPGEFIFYQQDNAHNFSQEGVINKFSSDNQIVYLIVKGEALIFEEDISNSSINKKLTSVYKTMYHEGESFGVKEFFCGVPYEFTAQSKTLTTVIKIQRQKFIEVIQRFPKDYESFVFIRDDLIFNSPDKFIKCQPCNRYDHSLYKCPRMHFLKRRLTAIYRHLYSEPQKRQMQKRSNNLKFHAVKNGECNMKKQLKLFRVRFIRELKLQFKEEKIKIQKENDRNSIHLFSGAISQIDRSKTTQIKLQNVDKGSNNQYEFQSGNKFDMTKINKNQLKLHSREKSNPPSFSEKIEAEFKGNPNKLSNLDNLTNSIFNQEQNGIKKKCRSNSQIEQNSPDDQSDDSDVVSSQNSFSSSEVSQQKEIMSSLEELLEIAEEEQDEMFYFKCPILIWNQALKKYNLSSEDDDIEGNNAIEQYLEANFADYLDSSGEIALLPIDYEEEDKNSAQDILPKIQDKKLSIIEPKDNVENNSTHTTVSNDETLNNNLQIRFNRKMLNETIAEEDFVKISSNSLSFFEELQKKPKSKYFGSHRNYEQNGDQPMQILKVMNENKNNKQSFGSEILSEEYNSPQKHRNSNSQKQSFLSSEHMQNNYGQIRDLLKINQLENASIKKVITLDSIFRSHTKQQKQLSQQQLLLQQQQQQQQLQQQQQQFQQQQQQQQQSPQQQISQRIESKILSNVQKFNYSKKNTATDFNLFSNISPKLQESIELSPRRKRKTTQSQKTLQTPLEKLRNIIQMNSEFMTHIKQNQMNANDQNKNTFNNVHHNSNLFLNNQNNHNNNNTSVSTLNQVNDESNNKQEINSNNSFNYDQQQLSHQQNQNAHLHKLHSIQQQFQNLPPYGIAPNQISSPTLKSNYGSFLEKKAPPHYRNSLQLQLDKKSFSNINNNIQSQQETTHMNNIQLNQQPKTEISPLPNGSFSSSSSRQSFFLGVNALQRQQQQKQISSIHQSQNSGNQNVQDYIKTENEKILIPLLRTLSRNKSATSILLNNSKHLEALRIDKMLEFIFSFDQVAQFQKYYPKHNSGIILKKYIKYQNNKVLKANSKYNPRTNILKKIQTAKMMNAIPITSQMQINDKYFK